MSDFFTKSLADSDPALAAAIDAELGRQRDEIERTAHALLSETGPLTATSANISGTPPHADCGDAASALGLPLEAALVGHCPGSTPSTFIRLDDSAPLTHAEQLEVLREGVIPTAEVMSWSTSRT